MRKYGSWFQKNIGAKFTHIYIYGFIVLGDYHDPPQPWTLYPKHPQGENFLDVSKCSFTLMQSLSLIRT